MAGEMEHVEARLELRQCERTPSVHRPTGTRAAWVARAGLRQATPSALNGCLLTARIVQCQPCASRGQVFVRVPAADEWWVLSAVRGDDQEEETTPPNAISACRPPYVPAPGLQLRPQQVLRRRHFSTLALRSGAGELGRMASRCAEDRPGRCRVCNDTGRLKAISTIDSACRVWRRRASATLLGVLRPFRSLTTPSRCGEGTPRGAGAAGARELHRHRAR